MKKIIMSTLKKIKYIFKPRAACSADMLFPRMFYIETTTKCNLQCTYCLRTQENFPTKNKTMEYAVFENIIIDISNFLKKSPNKCGPVFFLHGFGEPTLNKNLERMIKFTRSSIKNSQIRFVSNFCIKNSDDYNQYIKAGVDIIYISIDSPKQEIAEKTRKNINMKHICKTVEEVCRKNAGNIAAITVLTDRNVNDILEIYEYIKSIGIKIWNIQLHHVYNEGFNIPANLEDLRRKLGDGGGVQINFEGFPMPICTQPFDTLVINVDGNIVPCCSDTTGRLSSWGNINNTPASDIFNGVNAATFREEFSSSTPDLCKKCPYKRQKNEH